MVERKISRRTFNKLAVGSVATACGMGTLELAHLGITDLSRRLRPETPKYLPQIRHRSVHYGFSPNQNQNKNYISDLGITPGIVNFFVRGNLEDDYEVLNEIREAQKMGITPILSWGKYNANEKDLLDFARELKTVANPYMVRDYYEGNGYWTRSWYGHHSADEFQEKWIEFHDFMRNFGISTPLIFCPNTTEDILGTESIEKYYPGDQFVDIVGLDAYLKYSNYIFDLEHWFYPNLSPEEVLRHDIATLQKIAPSKKLIICEVNVTNKTSNRAQKLIRMFKEAVRAGAEAILTFDWDKRKQEGIDWRVASDHKVHRAVLEELANPYYIPISQSL